MKTTRSRWMPWGIVLACALVALAACGDNNNPSNDTTPNNDSPIEDASDNDTGDNEDANDEGDDVDADLPPQEDPPVCDPCSDIEWSDGPALDLARDHHMTFISKEGDDASLVVIGGITEGAPPTFIDEVLIAPINPDGTLEPWQQSTPLPFALAGVPAIQTPSGLIILIAGRTGQDGQVALSDKTLVARVTPDGVEGQWTESAPLPVSRFHHGGDATDTHIYITGGLDGNDASSSVFVGRLDENGVETWLQGTPLPLPLTHHSTFIHNKHLYVMGGFTGSLMAPNTQRAVHRALILDNGNLGPWQVNVGQLPPIATQANTVYGEHVYVLGGLGPMNFEDQVLRSELDDQGPVGFEAMEGSALPRPIGHTHHAPIHNGFMYFVSGGQRNRLQPDVHIGTLIP